MKRQIIIWLLVFMSSTLLAQNEDQFLPSELKQLTAVTEPATLRQGFLRVGTSWEYTGFRTIYDEDANKIFIPGSAIARAASFGLSVQYGITDRIQANLYIPYHMDKVESVQLFDDPGFRSIELENYAILQRNYAELGFGFGDLSAGIFTQLIKESDYIPAITIRTTAYLPTGRKNAGNISEDSLTFDTPTGSGEFALAVDIQAKKIVYPYSFSFYTGFDYGFGGEKVFFPGDLPYPFRSATVFYAAGGVNFHLNDWICMTNELYYTHIGREVIDNITLDNTKWRLMLMPYIHFQVNQLRLVQGVTIPLMGKLIPADPTYRLIVQYIF